MLLRNSIMIGMFLWVAVYSAEAWRERDESIFLPFGQQRSFLRPDTKEEVLEAYAWRVRLDNGVSRQEAVLIAQRELVLKEFYDDFRFADPWIVSEDKTQWTIRFPGKYSLTQETSNYFVCIAKKAGQIMCSEKR